MADIKNNYGTNLLAHYKCDEVSGTREDIHSTFDLTDVNTVGSTTGKIGTYALSLVKSNSEYLRNASDVWGSATALSINLWMKSTSPPSSTTEGQEHTYAHIGRASGYKELFLQAYKSDTTVYIGASYARPCVTAYTASVNAATYNLYDGNWHMLTAVWNGSTVKLYIDGTERASVSASGNGLCAATNGVNVGARVISGSPQAYADGVVDEVTIAATAWSSTDVTGIFNSGNGIPYEEAGGTTFTPRVIMF